MSKKLGAIHLLIEWQMLGKDYDNPEGDAASDLAEGYVYCYSLNGFGPYFPGVEPDIERKVCSSAIEVNIYGTSDSIANEAHANAIGKAKRYAYRYNKYVVRYLEGEGNEKNNN